MYDKRKITQIEIKKRMDFFLLQNKKTIAKVKINKAIIISAPNTKLEAPDCDHREEANRINLGR